MAIDGNDLMTNLGEALQFRGRVIFVFLLSVNIVVKVVKMRIFIFVIFTLYRVSQKDALSECCWSHSALAQ